MRRLAQRSLFLCALAAAAVAERPVIQTFTTEQGLISNGGIWSIQQDSQGFLWISTHEGVSRYDGATFRNYGPNQGLHSPAQIFGILVSSTGDVWVGSDAARYDPHAPEARRFRVITVGEEKTPPTNFMEDHTHAIWAVADGLYRNRDPVHSDAFERVCLNGSHVCKEADGVDLSLVEGADGSIWVPRSDNGLLRLLPSGRVERYGAAEGLPYTVLSVLRDNVGSIWAGTMHGLVRLVASPAPGTAAVAKDFAHVRGFPPCAVDALLQTRDGHIWAGARCGLVEIDGTHLRTYTVADGLTQAVIYSVFEDRDGDLWIGTESAGVMRMKRKHVSTFGPEAGLEQDVIDGTLLSRDGRVVVLGNRAGHFTLKVGDASGFQPLFSPQPLQPTNLGFEHWQVAFEDHEGKWWIPGTNTLKVFGAPQPGSRGQVVPLRIYDQASGLPAGRINCFAEDARGDIWFGLYSPPHSTVWQWIRSTGKFRSWEGVRGVSDAWGPLTFTLTRSGYLWMAYPGGKFGRYRNGEHLLMTSPPGRGITSFAIHEDDAGRLWTGRRDGTLYEILSPESEHPTLRLVPGVYAPFLRAILNDAHGRLYLASEVGLIQYDPRTNLVRHFHERDGLPSDVVQNGVRDRTGALWFGTGRGLMRFLPADVHSSGPPAAWIDGITVGGAPYAGLSDRGETVVRNLKFAEAAGPLKLDFNSINFTSDVRFQYRLVPGDKDWAQPTSERSVTYAGLRAGRYVFAVRAVDADAQVSQPATVTFAVLPPLWRRPWFFTVCAVALCILLSIAYQSRVNHLLQIERMRVRIASDLHDEIGANLGQIAVLSEQLMREDRSRLTPATSLHQIADTARELTGSLGDVVWSISPERDQLPDLLSRMRRLGNDLCDAHNIAFALHHDDEAIVAINGHVRYQLLLIFKEALRNAIRHSGCRTFSVDCVPDGSGVLFRFHDDGAGFDPALHVEGFGLANMKRRAASVQATITVHSGSGVGTTISIYMKAAA